MSRTTQPFWMIMPLLALMLLLGLALPQTSQAYPEPSIVPRSWDLKVTWEKPRSIAVKDIQGRYQWYWYMTYKVVNNTGQDRLFVPEVEIATDQGDLVRSNQHVPSAVFFAIKEKLGNSLLQSPNQVVGKLLQGDDFARESVVIWPVFDHGISQVSVFFAGLSGETGAIENPQTGEKVLVRKVLMINYSLPGDTMVTPKGQQTINEDSHRWIMR